MAERRKKRPVPYHKRRERYGYGFVGLWLVGTVLFFIVPLIRSLMFSFSKVTIDTGETVTHWVGLEKYRYVLFTDSYYTEYLGETLLETLWKTPLILIFSLFIAVLLNKKFRGRAIARAIFFLPVIIATGPVYAIISGDMDTSGSMGAEQFSTMFSTNMIGDLMRFLGIYDLSSSVSGMISGIADNIFSIVWSSGIQILLFLAALQNISPQVREAAMIEGATEWEYFWKITFPCVSPFILLNLIFTVIDRFIDPMNKVMERIHDMKEEWLFGEASAMAWIYFGIILAAIGVIVLVANKHIFYEVE